MRAILLASLLFVVALSLRIPFSLEYKGSCTGNSVYQCTGKAQSEHIDTLISAHGNPSTVIQRSFGSLSVWTCNGTVAADGTMKEDGSVTFGIHTNHEDHSFTYSGAGGYDSTSGCSSVFLKIIAGQGTLDGALGRVGQSSCPDPDDSTKFIAWVSGYIVVPDN